MSLKEIRFSDELIFKIVDCIADSVGDDILADIQHNDLRTSNSVPSRIWDLLNTNIIKRLDTSECTIAKAHRGPWEMLVVFEKTSQCIFTFMREKRFAELQRQQHKRKHMHYVDMLTRQFNRDLLSTQQQMSMFPKTFSDEEKLGELVQAMLCDLRGEAEVVRNHILVLFDTSGYQLTHVRAVMVTPTLDIADGGEQDWSKYISINESAVVEKVVSSNSPENNPNRGLTLKAKAIDRQKNRPSLLRDTIEASKEE